MRLITDYTHVYIQAQTSGRILYEVSIVMYPEREYHPKFLQLCDLFLDIAKEHTNYVEKKQKTNNSKKKVKNRDKQ